MIFIRTKRYRRKYQKLDKKIYAALRERLALFLENPRHPLLDNHALTGDRAGERSINITGDWRLIFEELDENTVRLLDVDTHHNLYGT